MKEPKTFLKVCSCQKTGKWGFINKEGKTVIPCQYDEVASFREGLVAVVKNGKVDI